MKKCEDGKNDYGHDADDADDVDDFDSWDIIFANINAKPDSSCWNSDGWDWSHLVWLLCKYASLPV